MVSNFASSPFSPCSVMAPLATKSLTMAINSSIWVVTAGPAAVTVAATAGVSEASGVSLPVGVSGLKAVSVTTGVTVVAGVAGAQAALMMLNINKAANIVIFLIMIFFLQSIDFLR